jgi:hypothetical protein
MDKIYSIPERNVDSFETKVAQLIKRATKLHSVPITVTKVSEEFKTIDKKIIKFVNFSVKGENPAIAGWKFLASLDILPEVGTVVRGVPGEDIPKFLYEVTASRCDHCQGDRYRVNHYAVQNISRGEVKIVGSTCLKDFVGHNVNAMLSYKELLSSITEAAEEAEESYGSHRIYIDLPGYLAFVAHSIKENGWIPRKASEVLNVTATADIALTLYLAVKDRKGPSDEAKELANKAIAWAKALTFTSDKALSDYEINLAMLAKAEYVPEKATGIAASLIPAYARSIGLDVSKKFEKIVSEYIGKVGDKLTLTLTIQKHNSYEGNYGISHQYIMRDPTGNAIVWWASKGIRDGNYDVDSGDVVTLKGTVKKLEEYNGVRQTVLTRCKVLEIKKKE